MYGEHKEWITTAWMKTNTDDFNATRHLNKRRFGHLSDNKASGLQLTESSKRCASMKNQFDAAVRKNSLGVCHRPCARTSQGPDTFNKGLENRGRVSLCVVYRGVFYILRRRSAAWRNDVTMARMTSAVALLFLALQVNGHHPLIVAIGDSITAGYGVAAE